ncbi:MAG: hypothetical protein KGO96_00855 [Elusimicrobia bacterium]|nr:hypothetical protein [Elusimicrobiota bacterium]MDE2424444.1 hypothetical protein [Elusimicrobiota bacterium]
MAAGEIAKTVLESATFLSVIGYFFQKYIAEPRQVIAKLITNVDADLVFYANMWANPFTASNARGLRAEDELRRHAADIRAAIRGIGPIRRFFLFGLPTTDDLHQSSGLLIRMANSITVPEGEQGEAAKRNRDAEARIRTLLRIPDGTA